MNKSIERRVREAFSKTTGRDANTINPNMTLDDMDMDSIDKLEVSVHIEDEFGITVSDQEIEKFTKVDDYVKFVERAAAT